MANLICPGSDICILYVYLDDYKCPYNWYIYLLQLSDRMRILLNYEVPELQESRIITERGDAYGFGVVMLELPREPCSFPFFLYVRLQDVIGYSSIALRRGINSPLCSCVKKTIVTVDNSFLIRCLRFWLHHAGNLANF